MLHPLAIFVVASTGGSPWGAELAPEGQEEASSWMWHCWVCSWLEDHCKEILVYCRCCNSVWRSFMAWFDFAEKTSADGEQGAGAGMQSVDGLSSRSECVTAVGGPQALPSRGGVRKCERAGHMSPVQQLPVITGPRTYPGLVLPALSFYQARNRVARAWPNLTSVRELLNPHLSHGSGIGLPCSSSVSSHTSPLTGQGWPGWGLG